MTLRVLIAVLASVAAGPALSAQGGAGRVRPPEAVTCPRNDLTLYAGRVTALEREKGSTSLTISTDWKTTERVTIRHPEVADPDAWFLMQGKPFVEAEWETVAPKGKLRDDIRAHAWVCRDGRHPIIDWQPAARNDSGSRFR